MTTSKKQESAYTTALLRSLQFSGVKFVRFFSVDVCNNVRCKVKPVDCLMDDLNDDTVQVSLNDKVSIASVCFAGLPYYADYMINGTGMTARDVLKLQPDLQSFRILPYAPKSAVMMCNVHDQYTDEPSPLCTRGLLCKVVDEAAKQHNIAFSVGVELEFCLVDIKTEELFVDNSVFANTITLNDQEPFLTELMDQLKRQYIPIELLHSESGPGQVEVVMKYSNDPVAMADAVLLVKETIRSVARQFGYRALMIPKYNPMKAGNGMHVHMSIRDATTGQPLFCDKNSLTEKGSSFVEGLLQHLPGLMGLTVPTVNSFSRIGVGCWTGSSVGWALEDKECGVRVCSNLQTKEWDHVEYKLMDSTCNLYLALAALFSCGLDGISRNVPLRPQLADAKDTPPEPLPESVVKAFEALEADNHLMTTLGPQLSKGFLALRRHEAEREGKMDLSEQVKESLSRS